MRIYWLRAAEGWLQHEAEDTASKIVRDIQAPSKVVKRALYYTEIYKYIYI